jgi:hypothetical protein
MTTVHDPSVLRQMSPDTIHSPRPGVPAKRKSTRIADSAAKKAKTEAPRTLAASDAPSTAKNTRNSKAKPTSVAAPDAVSTKAMYSDAVCEAKNMAKASSPPVGTADNPIATAAQKRSPPAQHSQHYVSHEPAMETSSATANEAETSALLDHLESDKADSKHATPFNEEENFQLLEHLEADTASTKRRPTKGDHSGIAMKSAVSNGAAAPNITATDARKLEYIEFWIYEEYKEKKMKERVVEKEAQKAEAEKKEVEGKAEIKAGVNTDGEAEEKAEKEFDVKVDVKAETKAEKGGEAKAERVEEESGDKAEEDIASSPESEGEGSFYHPERFFAKAPEVSTGSQAKISIPAYDRLELLYNASDAQNPDLGGIIHMWRDQEGYLVIEIINGQLWEYERKAGQRKRKVDVLQELWPIIEALVFFFHGKEDSHWLGMCPSGD